MANTNSTDNQQVKELFDSIEQAFETEQKEFQHLKDILDANPKAKVSPDKIGGGYLSSIEAAIEKGPWDKRLFFRVIGQKLRELRDQLRHDLSGSEATIATSTGTASDLASRVAQHAGQIEVFISLYNNHGGDLKVWEKVLHNLQTQVISRPIFDNQNDVLELIRSKANPENEAYLAVYVDKTDILKPIGGSPPRDVLGHALLTLKEGAVNADNMTQFVHSSGRYQYQHGQLIREEVSLAGS